MIDVDRLIAWTKRAGWAGCFMVLGSLLDLPGALEALEWKIKETQCRAERMILRMDVDLLQPFAMKGMGLSD